MAKMKPIKTVPAAGAMISDCNFTGINWDAKAVSAVQTLADGLLANAKANRENAEAMGKLVSVFRAQQIDIECLIKLESAADPAAFNNIHAKT